ncbi:stage III sporulation protein AE [uncultured Eubacterium sp.]|uniref:stage III sporulation protein AE n=1 Tax=uncultured Eubacterium sp. TaxID=165185 RepID=UPI0026162C41|nr:stage III sporulation protein AE [uncultured Eubacterium sp.]
MKRVFIVVFVILLIGILNYTYVKADTKDELSGGISVEDFDLSEGSNVLRRNGYDEINIKEIMHGIMNGNISDTFSYVGKIIYNRTIGDVNLVKKSIINLVLIIILSAFFTNFARVFSKDNVSETGFFICYLLAITIMVTLFENFCLITIDFVKLLMEFLYGIVPAYFLSVAIVGQASAVGFYQLVLVIIAVTEFIFLNIVIPLIKIYVAISLVNNISREDFLSKAADVIKNVIGFINKFMLATVTGINIIQGLILPAVDGVKNTTIRKFMGALPVIGDGTEAMTGIMLGSVNLIKNTIGGLTIIIILVICVIPFIKIQLYSLGVQIAMAVVQPIADKRIIDSLSCICDGTKLLARLIISAAILFIISIAIICMVTGKE